MEKKNILIAIVIIIIVVVAFLAWGGKTDTSMETNENQETALTDNTEEANTLEGDEFTGDLESLDTSDLDSEFQEIDGELNGL